MYLPTYPPTYLSLYPLPTYLSSISLTRKLGSGRVWEKKESKGRRTGEGGGGKMPREVLESLFMNDIRVFVFVLLFFSVPCLGPSLPITSARGRSYTLLWSLTVSGDVHFPLNSQESRLRRAHWFPTVRRAEKSWL